MALRRFFRARGRRGTRSSPRVDRAPGEVRARQGGHLPGAIPRARPRAPRGGGGPLVAVLDPLAQRVVDEDERRGAQLLGPVHLEDRIE